MTKNTPLEAIPFAQAKAHLSEVVDRVQHKGESVVITRHGKPVALITPPTQTKARARNPVKLAPPPEKASFADFLAEFVEHDTPKGSALDDLLASRR